MYVFITIAATPNTHIRQLLVALLLILKGVGASPDLCKPRNVDWHFW